MTNKEENKMENVIKQITGFVGGLGAVLMAVLPVTILWYILTGGAVFGMDVVANLTALITSLGNGGFVGLIVLVLLTSFFVKK
jgi:Na+/H+ antiporter NhaC